MAQAGSVHQEFGEQDAANSRRRDVSVNDLDHVATNAFQPGRAREILALQLSQPGLQDRTGSAPRPPAVARSPPPATSRTASSCR